MEMWKNVGVWIMYGNTIVIYTLVILVAHLLLIKIIKIIIIIKDARYVY